jgi:hypothetical protein
MKAENLFFCREKENGKIERRLNSWHLPFFCGISDLIISGSGEIRSAKVFVK